MKEYLVLRLALCACGLSGPAWAGPCYDVEVLWGQTCGIFGPAGVFPADIAADGTIVGAVEQCEHPELDEGFVWPIERDPFIIPRPVGATNLTANCINAVGQIGVQMTISGDEFGFLAHTYDIATGTFTMIGIPPGGNYSEPYGINNLGETCGKWGAPQNGFAFTDRGLVDLGPILDGTHSDAVDINDQGSVVGWMGNLTPSSTHRGFVYRDGKVIDFGVAPQCNNSVAHAINQHDEVAVGGNQPLLGGGLAGLPYLWVNGTWTALPMLAGFEDGLPLDINDDTTIVGGFFNPGETGFVWIEGVTYDLNERISAESGVEIRYAVAINNAGQIACEGTTQHPFFGFSRVGVRLTPRPPQPADLTDDCTVDGEDLTILLQSWGPLQAKRDATSAADLDGNRVVNGFDLAILLGAWG